MAVATGPSLGAATFVLPAAWTTGLMIAGFGGLLGSSYLFYSWLPDAPVFLNLTYGLTGFFVGAATTVRPSASAGRRSARCTWTEFARPCCAS